VSIELIVVTPDGEAFSGPVDEVVLPGSEGEFGVLEQHERFLAALRYGVMETRTSQGSVWAAISDGFADVSAERVVVMVDSHDRADAVAIEAARRAHDQAESELAADGSDAASPARRAELERLLARAKAHIEAHGKL
jgi:F-type H+-transporting ATPase subunit epsilon